MIAQKNKIFLALTCIGVTLQLFVFWAWNRELTSLQELATKQTATSARSGLLYVYPASAQIQNSVDSNSHNSPVPFQSVLRQAQSVVWVSASGYETAELRDKDYPNQVGQVLELRPTLLTRILWWSPLLVALLSAGLALRNHYNTAVSNEERADQQEATQTMAVAGRTIDNKYLLLRRVGEGATSEVWEATSLLDPSKGQKVAFKWLLAEVSQNEDLRARFEREIRICRQLEHPNLIQVLDHGQADGRLWLVQPWLEARSLDQQPLPLPVPQVRQILADIAAGLHHAHGRGIQHRDLKPANVLLLQNGRAVIVDFGIARGQAYPTITKTATLLGTPAYIAPEQITGRGREVLSDLYSFGCLAFELLSGQLPYQEADALRLLTAHMAKPPRTLLEARPDFGEEGWQEWLDRLLDKDPERRFPDAQTAAKALPSTKSD